MNLNNRIVSNKTAEKSEIGRNCGNKSIPQFQTVQNGSKRNKESITTSEEWSDFIKISTSSSSNISAHTLMFGARQFPAAYRKKPTNANFKLPLANNRNHSNLKKSQPSCSNTNRIFDFLGTSETCSSGIQTDQGSYFNSNDTENETPNDTSSCEETRRIPNPKTKSSSTTLSGSNFFSATPRKNVRFTTPKPLFSFRTPRSSSGKTTKCSSSATSSDPSNNVVVALTEGRGNSRGEVGLAASDSKRPYLILCQISDTQTYTNILRKINILNPIEIIIPNTFYENMNTNSFYQVLTEHFPKVRITTVQRKYFSDTDGFNQIKELCLQEYSSVLPIVQRKYFTLAAAAALLKFIEFQRNIVFSPKSLRVDYQGGDSTLFIDLQTAERLELVINQSMDSSSPNTLFKVMNKCSTISGQKHLRSLILQPSADTVEINSRLSCVEELIGNGEVTLVLKALLPKFWDVEQLLGICAQISNYKDNDTAAEILINYALLLKTTLEAIPALKKALSNTKSTFFKKFEKTLEKEEFEIMLREIYEVLNDDAHLSPKYEVNLFQRCFSIKTGLSSFLDVARIAYVELVQDFNEIVDDLIKKYHLPLTIKTLKSKGFVLHMKVNENFRMNSLPSVFVQVQKSKSAITMTTKELLFLKERIKHFTQEIQLLSSAIIFKMLQEIREHIGVLYKFCENIAELDLIVSFAVFSKQHSFVRPIFSKDRTLVKASVHPILNQISKNKPVANDIVSSTDENMTIITGPNMGGKSIYIRQVALLQIMGQMGCYIPAEYAELRLTDRIFSRIGFHDSIECNASTFIVEVTEMQYIIKSLTPRSLIIIDELCRGTSTEEGASLAWAMCEELLASKAFTFCTTHFLYLTKLQDLYPNVVNYHLEALEMKSDSGITNQLLYTHRMVPGVIKLDHYGLKLARSTAVSESVLKISEEMSKQLTQTWKVTSAANESITYEKQIDNIVLKLLEMLDNGMLTIAVVDEIMDFAKENGMLFRNPSNTNEFQDQIIETEQDGRHESETADQNSMEYQEPAIRLDDQVATTSYVSSLFDSTEEKLDKYLQSSDEGTSKNLHEDSSKNWIENDLPTQEAITPMTTNAQTPCNLELYYSDFVGPKPFDLHSQTIRRGYFSY